jgi:hypothetical protein
MRLLQHWVLSWILKKRNRSSDAISALALAQPLVEKLALIASRISVKAVKLLFKESGQKDLSRVKIN